MANIVPFTGGRLPPALINIEVEVALLAALLANNTLAARVSMITKSRHFTDPLHARVFDAIVRLINIGMIANALTLKTEFDLDPAFSSSPKGSGPYLAQLTAGVVTLHNLEDYAIHLRELWMRRELMRRSQAIIESMADLDTPVDALIAGATKEIGEISLDSRGTSITGREAVEAIVDQIMNPKPCYSSGIDEIDDAMAGGFYSGKLYGLGARKKVGKTIMLATWSQNMNAAGIRHLFISGEMSPLEIEQRNVSRDLGINPIAFLKAPGRGLADKTAEYHARMSANTIYEHKPGLTLDELHHLVATAIVRHGIKGFILDYWQLVRGRHRDETQEQHQGNVAQLCADICKRHGIFGIVAAQLNQEGNSRGGEGLKLWCDLYWALHREKGNPPAVLRMEESRYCPYKDVGTDNNPILWLHNGSYFDGIPPNSAETGASDS